MSVSESSNQREQVDMNEYEIIPGSERTNSLSEEEDDELGYAVARSLPFPNIRGAMDVVSTSDAVFPTLFHQRTNTITSDSITVEIQRMPPLIEGPLDVLWMEPKEESEDESVYRKVANWVMSQRRYLREFEKEDEDDIEVIDPVDLFHDTLLDEYMLLTETDSEKRMLLREIQIDPYSLESLPEAMENYDYEFLRKPNPCGEFELESVTCEDRIGSNEDEEEAIEYSNDMKPFLGLTTMLENYLILDREGQEMPPDWNEDFIIQTEESDELVAAYETMIKSPDVTEMDIVSFSIFGDGGDTNADACTTATVPTDVVEIATTVIAENESEDNDSDEIWADAKDIPHWLDSEHEEHLFNQPHRPFYYYRDRIKGCYRIIGVEDETVVLFSENDDDSIFYGKNMNTDIDANGTSRSNSFSIPRVGSFTTMPSIAEQKGVNLRNPLFPALRNRRRRSFQNGENSSEKKNDSGIEDSEDNTIDENGDVTLSLSASEATALGRVTKMIKGHRSTKSVSFEGIDSERYITEYVFVTLGTFSVSVALAVFIVTLLSNEAEKDLKNYQHWCWSVFNNVVGQFVDTSGKISTDLWQLFLTKLNEYSD